LTHNTDVIVAVARRESEVHSSVQDMTEQPNRRGRREGKRVKIAGKPLRI
jgi:hypothetical protein